jgi:hypothetical protein
MLTAKQRDELLLRIDERVEKLRGDMKDAKSAEGFARCQVHQREMDNIKNSLKWSKRTVIGGVITLDDDITNILRTRYCLMKFPQN